MNCFFLIVCFVSSSQIQELVAFKDFISCVLGFSEVIEITVQLFLQTTYCNGSAAKTIWSKDFKCQFIFFRFISVTSGATRCDVCFIFMVSCQFDRRVVNIRASMFSVLNFISLSSLYLSQTGPLHHSVRREQVLLRKGESSKPLKPREYLSSKPLKAPALLIRMNMKISNRGGLASSYWVGRSTLRVIPPKWGIREESSPEKMEIRNLDVKFCLISNGLLWWWFCACIKFMEVPFFSAGSEGLAIYKYPNFYAYSKRIFQ